MQALNAWAEVLAARPSQASAEQSLSLLIQTCRSIAGPGQAEAEPLSSPRKSIFSSLQAPSLFSHAARDTGGGWLIAAGHLMLCCPDILCVTGRSRRAQQWRSCLGDVVLPNGPSCSTGADGSAYPSASLPFCRGPACCTSGRWRGADKGSPANVRLPGAVRRSGRPRSVCQTSGAMLRRGGCLGGCSPACRARCHGSLLCAASHNICSGPAQRPAQVVTWQEAVQT